MSTLLARQLVTMNEQQVQRPRVVEVVGPAGAGKSTLCWSLAASQSVCLSNFPDVRRLANAPFFAWHGLEAATRFARAAGQASGRLNRQELAWLAILYGWPGLLRSRMKSDSRVHVLDQGPVYLMSELRESGPASLKEKGADQGWQALYGRWARILDAVVCLDAPDAVLAERIRARGKAHVMKDQPDQTVVNFLGGFRATYRCILSALSARNSALRILSFDTRAQSPDEIASELMPIFGLTD